FPEPDLPPLVVSPERIAAIRDAMPELPNERQRRFVAAYGLPEYDASQLTQSRELSEYFESAVRAGAPPKLASNWIMGELARKLKDASAGVAASPITPVRLAGLLALIDRGTISGSMAKDVFEKMYASDRSADDIVQADGLMQIDDE